MAVVHYWYAYAFVAAFDKEIDYLADTLKVMMTTSSYTPNQDTHDYADSTGLQVNEVSGTAYVADGDTITTPTNPAPSSNLVTFDGDDTVWSTSTIASARRAVLYDSTPGSDATNPLMTFVDFGQDESSSAGDFTIAWNASGIATITPTDATGYP